MNKYQISKIKDQIYISKIKNKKIFDILYACPVNFVRNFTGVFFIFNILYLIFGAISVSASPTYPISSLDNCRDQKECKLYCEIPQNTPACWSYGKYVMNSDVLGESAVNITYPIGELGNCNSAQECFLYCAQPKNHEACENFAENHGLVKEDEEEDDMDDAKKEELLTAAKTELGCNSKKACMALCNDPNNMDKCRTFAQKHGLDRGGPPPEIMQKAKSELGCDSETSCMNFCQNPQNQNKCFEFAKKNGMMREEDAKRMEEMMEKKKQMMEAAKTELGCDSFESCGKICSDPANREKCMNMGRKFGMVREEVRPMSSNMQKPCTSETECKAYCQSHPDECPGMSGRPNYNASDTALRQPMKIEERKGDYLGPSGCRTEDECRAYCEKHPDACPGFPKSPSIPIPTTQTRPMTTPSLQYKPAYPTSYSTQDLPYNPQTQTYGTNYQQIPGNYSPQENYQPPPNPSDYPH